MVLSTTILGTELKNQGQSLTELTTKDSRQGTELDPGDQGDRA